MKVKELMSGGHFNYRENQIGDTASEIEKLIAINVCERHGGGGVGNSYPPEIIEKFEEAAHTLRQAAEMVKRIDYLVSGDDGQDTFLRLWQTEVRKSWCCPTIPTRPPLGTRVKHTTHGKGKIFSYEGCDDASCGVDFGRKGQWCIAISELIIPPSTQALVRSAAPTARELAEKFDIKPLSEENHSKNLAAARLRHQP